MLSRVVKVLPDNCVYIPQHFQTPMFQRELVHIKADQSLFCIGESWYTIWSSLYNLILFSLAEALISIITNDK